MKDSYTGYSDFLTDESFICWVINPTNESDSFWLAFLEENPHHKNNIARAIQTIKSSEWNKTDFTDDEISAMYDEIIRRNDLLIGTSTPHIKRFYFLYAIVAIFILAILSVGIFKYIGPPSGVEHQFSLSDKMQSDDLYDKEQIVLDIDNKKYYFEEEIDVQLIEGQITINSTKGQNLKNIEVSSNEVPLLMYIPHAKRSSIVLADHSKLWINSGTTIAFLLNSTEGLRKVCVDGEVYASIARNEQRPFVVETPSIEVKVLGTEFNVYAYKDDANSSVVLVSGSVTVSDDLSSDHHLLMPNERLQYSDRSFAKSKVDVNDYISWRNGVLQFSGESLYNITAKLSQYYGVKIKCDSSIKNKQMSGKLVLFHDVNAVLNSLSDIFSVSYSVAEDGIIIIK